MERILLNISIKNGAIMKNTLYILILITLFSSLSQAEVVLRNGTISPEGIKSGVKVTCTDKKLEESIINWFTGYSNIVKNLSKQAELKVTQQTLASGLVVIRLNGFKSATKYSLQPSSGCGVSSYVETTSYSFAEKVIKQ